MYGELCGCKVDRDILIDEIVIMSDQCFSEGCFFKGESHPCFESVCVPEGSVEVTAEATTYPRARPIVSSVSRITPRRVSRWMRL